MTSDRLAGLRVLACVCLLVVVSGSMAAAQLLPMPGQSTPSAQFPPASGQSGAFPPPPGQPSPSQRAQPSPFPPPPGQTAAPSASGRTAVQVRPMSPMASPGQPSSFSAMPGQGGFQARPASPFPPPNQNQSVCAQFPAIRSDVEKGAAAIRAASERKATTTEVCPLFKRFAAREAKMVKFLATNQTTCGVPPDAVKQARANHNRTLQIRNQVCSAKAAPPPGPSLSDALGGPIIADDTTATQPGRGTFDTLTGNVLAR